MDNLTLTELLREGESARLDYKAVQYPFASASDSQKAELLKDILAMANAWREQDAYILLGIASVSGQIATIVGVSDRIDDAALQQFVNSKLNRVLTFSYTEEHFERKVIGILHVPIQQRPFFLTSRYAQLEAETIYIRRGSSTGLASIDEVFAMGAATTASPEVPRLTVEFADIFAIGSFLATSYRSAVTFSLR